MSRLARLVSDADACMEAVITHGGHIMTHTHLIQTHHRNALEFRAALSKKPLAAIAVVALWLAGALMALGGGPAAVADDRQQVATEQAAPASSRVNINTADAVTLAESLRGVGETRAREIVRHRETYGPFASAEELMEVKGIGQATLDQNRDLITLE
jgi:competence protein ComEA